MPGKRAGRGSSNEVAAVSVAHIARGLHYVPGTWLQPPVYQCSLPLSFPPPILQPRLDAVASQPPITRLAHVLTAAFGCDLVAGQSDGSSDDDGLASGQHTSTSQPLPCSTPVPCPPPPAQ